LTEELLKGRVSLGRTIPLGSFNSLKVEVQEEYYLGQRTFEEVFDELAERMKKKLADAGVVRP